MEKSFLDYLQKIHEAADDVDAKIRREVFNLDARATKSDVSYKMRHAFMCVRPEVGQYLYSVIIDNKLKSIFEFGTSFGVSALYIGKALQDQSAGKLVTTEVILEKIEIAKQNCENAGLLDYVFFVNQDAEAALETQPSKDIDLLFLDGPKDKYLNVLKKAQKFLSRDAFVVCDNSNHPATADCLRYLRDPQNGFVSNSVSLGCFNNIEITIEVARRLS